MQQVETLPDGSPNFVRCPDYDAAAKMVELIDEVRRDTDSIGGVSEIVATNVPAGLGEPVFDKLKADLAKALFSLPAVLGVEYGIGFGCAEMRGSQNNDIFVAEAAGFRDPDSDQFQSARRNAGRYQFRDADRTACGDQTHQQPCKRTTDGHS